VLCKSAKSSEGLCSDDWNDRPFSGLRTFNGELIPRYAASLAGRPI
jgi:hypothetical protein